jgi:hypothetical protein
VARPAPLDQFYSPSGIVHADAPLSDAGILYVANANSSKHYDNGSVMAVNLDRVALPPFPAAAPAGGPSQISMLNLEAMSVMAINSFAGELASFVDSAGTRKLFVTTRAEGNFVHSLTAVPPTQVGSSVELRCANAMDTRMSCVNVGASFLAFEKNEDNQPRAPAPYGVAVSGAGDVFVTHSSSSDTPKGSLENFKAYLVRLAANDLTISETSFIDLGVGASTAVAVGSKWAYVSGRYVSPQAQLIRLVNRDGKVMNSGIEGAYRVLEARGLALSKDEQHIYLAGRAPDTLVVISITGATTDTPRLRVERAVPLPEGADQIRVISRPGRGDLVVIACSVANMVAIYDHDIGDLVAQVSGVGLQPTQLAIDERGAGARVYVSNFGDGRVAVIDIPDLAAPQQARLVAHLGMTRLCLDGTDNVNGCDGGTP